MCTELKMINQVILLSNQQIEESLFDYNILHLNSIDFDHHIDFDHPIYLLQHINTIKEIQYIYAILLGLIGIYYFVIEIYKTFYQN